MLDWTELISFHTCCWLLQYNMADGSKAAEGMLYTRIVAKANRTSLDSQPRARWTAKATGLRRTG